MSTWGLVSIRRPGEHCTSNTRWTLCHRCMLVPRWTPVSKWTSGTRWTSGSQLKNWFQVDTGLQLNIRPQVDAQDPHRHLGPRKTQGPRWILMFLVSIRPQVDTLAPGGYMASGGPQVPAGCTLDLRFTSGTGFTPRPQWDRTSQMDFRPKEDTKTSGRYPGLR